MSKQNFKEYTYTLTAGQIIKVNSRGTHVRVLENSANHHLEIRIGDTQSFQVLRSGIGYNTPDGESFEYTEIRNPHASDPMTVTLIVAQGSISDSRLTVSGTLQTDVDDNLAKTATITYDDDASVTTTQKELIASNTDRNGFIIQADPDNTDDIYIGYDSSVASTKAGFRLQPGGAFGIDNVRNYTGAIHVVSASGTQKLYFQEW